MRLQAALIYLYLCLCTWCSVVRGNDVSGNRTPDLSDAILSSYLSMYHHSSQTTLKHQILSYLQLPSTSMWNEVQEISEERPFFFFHQRKAGQSLLNPS